MTKTKIYQDRNQYETKLHAWENEKRIVQAVVNLYKKTGMAALEGNDLHRMFNDTEDFMFDKLTGGVEAHLTIGKGEDRTHLPIVKSKAIDILQKPKGYNELHASIDALKQPKQIRPGAVTWLVHTIANIFVVDDKGVVQFTEKKAAEIKETGNYYINSTGGNKLYAFVQDVVSMYYEKEIDKIQFSSRGENKIVGIMSQIIDSLNDQDKSFTANTGLCRIDSDLFAIENRKSSL